MHRLTYTIIAQTQYEDKNSIIGFAVVLYILGVVELSNIKKNLRKLQRIKLLKNLRFCRWATFLSNPMNCKKKYELFILSRDYNQKKKRT